MSRSAVATTLTVDINHRLLAEHLIDVLAERGLVIAPPTPDSLIESDQVRRLLGRAPGRPLSYPSLKGLIEKGELHPAAGPDGRKLYFSRKEVENLLGK